MRESMDIARTKMTSRSQIPFAARLLMLVAAGLMVAATAGCGSGNEEIPQATGQVSGTVALAGRPLKQGTVHFYSLQTNITQQATVGNGGKFALETPLPPGEYTVFLSGVFNAPEKFLSETSSDYTASIKEGTNEVAIDMK